MQINVLRYMARAHSVIAGPGWSVATDRRTIEVRDHQFVAITRRTDFVSTFAAPYPPPAENFEVRWGNNVICYPLIVKKATSHGRLVLECAYLVVSDRYFDVIADTMVADEKFGTTEAEFRSHVQPSYRPSDYPNLFKFPNAWAIRPYIVQSAA